MSFVRAMLVAWCFGAIAGGCTSDLQLDLAGKRCNAEDRCVEGYVCDRSTKTCVPNSQLFPSSGAGGSAGNPSTGGKGGWTDGGGWNGKGGSGSGQVGVSGGGSIGGSTGGSGDAGLGGGGDAEPDLDAGLGGPPDASDGCAVTTVFRDEDGDSFGAGPAFSGCPQPGWVTNADDCGDGEPLANPLQQGFFGKGFDHVDHPGIESFDYDCSGAEEVDPGNDPATGEPNCSEITDLLSCMGRGYLPSARSGDGVNPLCGSRTRRSCEVRSLLGCTGVNTNLTAEDAFRCR